MKLGLLVVLAVAVLVPSLSESRIISKCELKEKLGDALELYLPWKFQRFKERIVKIVVCKLMRLSNLNTGLVKVRGKRRTTTTARPTPVVTTRATTTRPTTTRPTTTEATTTTTTAETTTTRPTITEANTTTTTTETTTTRPTITEANTATEATARESGAPRSTLEPNRTATELGKRRKKREADTDEPEDSKELERSLEEILNQQENLFDEEEMEQDDNRTDSDEESGEDGEDEQDSVESDEDSVESGKRKKRFIPRWKPKRRRTWSLGYYGLFQLSDSYFCDSGHRWSHNRCQTSCSAFTDDDITDDIDCFVQTGYWWHVLKSGSFHGCHYYVRRRFRQCN